MAHKMLRYPKYWVRRLRRSELTKRTPQGIRLRLPSDRPGGALSCWGSFQQRVPRLYEKMRRRSWIRQRIGEKRSGLDGIGAQGSVRIESLFC